MKTFAPHLFRDTMELTPAGEPLALVFLPADRETLAEEIAKCPPSYHLEMLRQQLMGQPAMMPVACIHQEHDRLRAHYARGGK